MPPGEPRWWYERERGLSTRLAAPFGRLYGAIAAHRFRKRRPYRSRLPVICIGNLTLGGTGKTPLALLIAEYLVSRGESPVFLTRGYRGRQSGPVWVNERHTARDVGDEPLLLARLVPALVSRDRKAGAQAIEKGGATASVIIMDDGLQNPALDKDLVIAIVDGERGIGNGLVFPAGPLRAPLGFQLRLIDAIVVNGVNPATDEAAGSEREAWRRSFSGPVFSSESVPAADSSWLAGAPVVAYAGIGHPERFFRLLQGQGAELMASRAFPDHHVFRGRDAAELLALAKEHEALLVTTEKDWARFAGSTGARARLREASHTLPIRLAFPAPDGERLAALIDAAVETGGYRPRRAVR